MPKKVDHDERREELVLAAWRVIAANGIDEVTIRDIARESGYSSGVLAHYFKNKDDLLAHALQLSHTRIRKRYDAEREQADAADALKAILLDNLPLDEQREMETRIEMSFWARALRNGELHDIQQDESETLRKLLRELVKQAQKDGDDRRRPQPRGGARATRRGDRRDQPPRPALSQTPAAEKAGEGDGIRATAAGRGRR